MQVWIDGISNTKSSRVNSRNVIKRDNKSKVTRNSHTQKNMSRMQISEHAIWHEEEEAPVMSGNWRNTCVS